RVSKNRPHIGVHFDRLSLDFKRWGDPAAGQFGHKWRSGFCFPIVNVAARDMCNFMAEQKGERIEEEVTRTLKAGESSGQDQPKSSVAHLLRMRHIAFQRWQIIRFIVGVAVGGEKASFGKHPAEHDLKHVESAGCDSDEVSSLRFERVRVDIPVVDEVEINFWEARHMTAST